MGSVALYGLHTIIVNFVITFFSFGAIHILLWWFHKHPWTLKKYKVFTIVLSSLVYVGFVFLYIWLEIRDSANMVAAFLWGTLFYRIGRTHIQQDREAYRTNHKIRHIVLVILSALYLVSSTVLISRAAIGDITSNSTLREENVLQKDVSTQESTEEGIKRTKKTFSPIKENSGYPGRELPSIDSDRLEKLKDAVAELEAGEANPDNNRGSIYDRINEDTSSADISFEKTEVTDPPKSFQTVPNPQETEPTPPEPVTPSTSQLTEETLQGIWVQGYMDRQPFDKHILFKFTGNEVYYESYYNSGSAEFVTKEYGTFSVNENNSICIHTTRKETYYSDGTVDVNDELDAHWSPRPITNLQSDTYTTSEILVYNRINQIPPLVGDLLAQWAS